MAASMGDIIRITDRQTLLGQQVLNVYFYVVNVLTGLGADYLELMGDWFTDNVVDDVRLIQDSGLLHTGLFLENVSNGTDIFELTDGYPLAGTNGWSNPMPSFVSAGFQLIREERNTRNGYKRIGGISENDVTNGVYTGLSTTIDAIEEALAADMVIGIVNVAAPVIVRHPITVPLVSPVYSNIGSAQYRLIGSQNTRKAGRGS